MKHRQVGILTIGHLATDINQGALPAMLPFFIAVYDLSNAAAALIVFATNMTSSIVQPLFGYAADRFSKPWLLSAGLMLAGAGLALSGVSQSYVWILVLALVSGIGIAAYHPEAARLVNFAAGTRKSTAMGIFGVGGTMGFSIGPLVVTAALLQWGLRGTLVLILPATIMALVMASQFSTFESLAMKRRRNPKTSTARDLSDNWFAFGLLTITVIGKSILFYALNTFIPIYWVIDLNQTKTAGAMALTIFAGSGIFGTLLGGRLADRMGPKKVVVFGYVGVTLILPMLVLTRNVHLLTLSLIPIGLMLGTTYSPTIVLGQNYLPNRVGLSSGVTLGLGVAIGGGAAPIIGRIADMYGIWFALASIASLPIVIVAFALSLPGSGKVANKSETTQPG